MTKQLEDENSRLKKELEEATSTCGNCMNFREKPMTNYGDCLKTGLDYGGAIVCEHDSAIKCKHFCKNEE